MTCGAQLRVRRLPDSEAEDQEAFRQMLADQRQAKLDMQKANHEYMGEWKEKGLAVRVAEYSRHRRVVRVDWR